MEKRQSTTARRLRNPAGQRPIPFGGGVGPAASLGEASSGQSSGFDFATHLKAQILLLAKHKPASIILRYYPLKFIELRARMAAAL